jgi:hypothetical protein
VLIGVVVGITPTASPALTVGTIVLQSVQVSLPFTSSTPSVVVSTSAPQVSSFPSSTPLVIVPSLGPLVISSSSSVSSSSTMAGQVTRFTFNAFGPLDIAAIPRQPHALPTTNYVKKLPKFQGNNAVNAQEHIDQFLKVCDDEGVEHEDVAMKMFVSTLEGEARSWYKSLQNNSISGLNPFFEKFLERWGDKHDTSFLLRNFTDLNKKENEIVLEFNTRFAKAYHKIPATLKPNVEFALISYLEKFDGILGVLIRQKEPTSLDVAYQVAITTEKHLSLASKAQVPLSLLLDPQDRRTNPPAQALPEPKQEEGTSKDATFGLVNDLSNRIVKVEKMLQNQLVISQPKPINKRRPYQYPKKNDEPKPPTQASGTNYIDYASSSLYFQDCTLPHSESSCAIFAQTTHLYEQGEDPSDNPDNTLNMVAEFEPIEEPYAFQASDVTKVKPHSAFQVPQDQWKALQPDLHPIHTGRLLKKTSREPMKLLQSE